ncbi:unnamed protein product [Penicillium glandicola]
MSTEVDDDGFTHIQTSPAIPLVLPSVEDDIEEDYSILSLPTGVKRKRDEALLAAEGPAPSSSYDPSAAYIYSQSSPPAIDESRMKLLEALRTAPWRTTTAVEHPVTFSAFPPPGLTATMAPLQPLELPGSPPTISRSRVWETNRPSNTNFTIYEDPAENETPKPSPLQEGFHTEEEDKENIYLTRSDFDSSSDEEDETHPDLTWNEASIGPRDAFGLPLSREMSDFVPASDIPLPERHMRRGREVLRTIWVDEAQAPEEDEDFLNDESLGDAQLREIEQIEASYHRGQINRADSNRHQALREDIPVQAATNFHADVRRILNFQRHEGRHPAASDDDEEDFEELRGRLRITPDEGEESEEDQGQ